MGVRVAAGEREGSGLTNVSALFVEGRRENPTFRANGKDVVDSNSGGGT